MICFVLYFIENNFKIKSALSLLASIGGHIEPKLRIRSMTTHIHCTGINCVIVSKILAPQTASICVLIIGKTGLNRKDRSLFCYIIRDIKSEI